MRLPSDDDYSPAPVTAAIPSVVDGTELVGEFAGSGYREPPLLVCRPDGQVVQLPPVLYLLVKVLDRQRRSAGKRLDKDEVLSQAADVLSKATGREFNGEHIVYLIDRKLAPLDVTTYSDGSVPDAGKAMTTLSLRYRVGVFSEGVTSFFGGLFAWLYWTPVMLLALLATVGTKFLATAWQKGTALGADIAGMSGKELDPLEVVGSSFHIFMGLLAVGGIGLLSVLAVKGTIRVVRRHAEQAGPRHALVRGQHPRVPHGSGCSVREEARRTLASRCCSYSAKQTPPSRATRNCHELWTPSLN